MLQILKRGKTAAIPPVPDYSARTLAYLAFAATLAVGHFTGFFGRPLLIALLFALIYPHLAHMATRSFRVNHAHLTHALLIALDGLIFGVGLVVINFAMVPCILFLIMVNFGFIVVGGIPAWTTGVTSLVFGITIGLAIFGHTQAPPEPLIVNVVCGVGVGIYICITAYFTHQQAHRLVSARAKIQRQEEQAKKLSRKLAKYLSPQIWESIFSGRQEVKLESQRKKLVVFFSDIRGFTELSDQLESEGLTELLNQYLNDMAKIAIKYGGTIDKFMGDGIMIFFGDPVSQGTKKDALACVAMAIAMRRHMRVLRQHWRSRGIRTPLEIRMGINTGYCTVGNFGAENRLDYTIIGKEVNLASRLESEADAGEILLSYETYSLVKDTIMCRDNGEISVKGFMRPVPIYQVVDFRRDLGANQSFIEHEADGFSMYLDIDKIQGYDKERVIRALEQATDKIRNKLIL